MAKRKPMEGRKFGRLTVVEYLGLDERNNNPMYLMRCPNGHLVRKYSSALFRKAKAGANPSCPQCQAIERKRKAKIAKQQARSRAARQKERQRKLSAAAKRVASGSTFTQALLDSGLSSSDVLALRRTMSGQSSPPPVSCLSADECEQRQARNTADVIPMLKAGHALSRIADEVGVSKQRIWAIKQKAIKQGLL